MRASALLLTSALHACSGVCRAPDDLAGGVIEAEVDGAAWRAQEAGYSEAGGALQVSVDRSDGYTLSMLLRSAVDGRPLLDLLAAEELPAEAPLGDGDDGNWVIIYVEGVSSSFSTTAGLGGALVIAAVDGDQLLGCLDFEAASQTGDTLGFEGGRFRLQPR